MGDDVLLESELNDDYSIENADEGFEEEEEGPTAADMEDLFSDDGDAGILPEGEDF